MTNPRFRRRRFLGGVLGAAAAAPVLGASFGIDEAWAGAPATGSHDSVEHVVILMQENRSFDHYYDTMAGVRHAARPDGGYLPFHVDTSTVDGQDLPDLAHDWDTIHLAFDGGRNDKWVAAKTEGRWATSPPLASAFTICDDYFCSIQGPTTPNRLYHWTGTIDPGGVAGGPATTNPDDHKPVFTWTTYPERLQKAGVSWQVYANDEVGDGADGQVGDYGDTRCGCSGPTTTRWRRRIRRSTSWPTARARAPRGSPTRGRARTSVTCWASSSATAPRARCPPCPGGDALQLLRAPRGPSRRGRGLRPGRAERHLGQPEAARLHRRDPQLRRERRLLRPHRAARRRPARRTSCFPRPSRRSGACRPPPDRWRRSGSARASR